MLHQVTKMIANAASRRESCTQSSKLLTDLVALLRVRVEAHADRVIVFDEQLGRAHLRFAHHVLVLLFL